LMIKKLKIQVKETEDIRTPLYKKVRIKSCKKILDVGCGSGVITLEIVKRAKGKVICIDNNPEMIKNAKKVLKKYRVELIIGDANNLPFKKNSFDLVVCNLLLMWVKNPQKVVDEMTRCSRKYVMATLEPDYGGKITYPEYKKIDKILGERGVKKRGGDPFIGRKLRAFFIRAKLESEVGISYKRLWSCKEEKESFEKSRNFYKKVLRDFKTSEKEIRSWEESLMKAYEEGVAIGFSPMFYAIGKKI